MGCDICTKLTVIASDDYTSNTYTCESRLSNLKSFPFDRVPEDCKRKGLFEPVGLWLWLWMSGIYED
jgi:hypothetical protein